MCHLKLYVVNPAPPRSPGPHKIFLRRRSAASYIESPQTGCPAAPSVPRGANISVKTPIAALGVLTTLKR